MVYFSQTQYLLYQNTIKYYMLIWAIHNYVVLLRPTEGVQKINLLHGDS